MVPDRSITPVGTERLHRRRATAIGCAAVLITVGIAGVAVQSRSEPVAVSSSTAGTPGAAGALVVGADRTVTLLSLGGAGTDPILSRVGSDMGAAVTAVEGFWGTDWSHEIVVVAAETDAEYRAAAPGAPADMAAVAVSDGAGQRIVLGPGANRMSDRALRIVLAHELFHYAARTDTAPDAPRWLTEGVADYVARQDEPRPEHFPVPGGLPDDTEFDAAGAELSAAYDRAWLFARYIAERYGAPTLRTLYLRGAGPDRVDIGTALQQTVGEDADTVLAGWRHWLAVPLG